MIQRWYPRFFRGARYLTHGFEQHFTSFATKHQFVPAEAQVKAVRELGRILTDLKANREAFENAQNAIVGELNNKAQKEARAPPYSRSLASLFRFERQPSPPPSDIIHIRNKGAYLHGPVGQGKTVLLDLLHNYLSDSHNDTGLNTEGILRCHFHLFMLAIHQALYEEQLQDEHLERIPIREAVEQLKSLEAQGVKPKKSGFVTSSSNDRDLVVQLAKRMVAEGLNVVLLDEFQITNISDALIFKRLFSQLFQYGVALVCTSNCPIEDLYQGGLNRDRFLDFIPILRRNCAEVEIDTKRDLRMVRRQNTSRQDAKKDSNALSLTDSLTIVTPSRDLETISKSLVTRGVVALEHKDQSVPLFHRRVMRMDYYNPDGHFAVISFDDLCRNNTAPADFIALARNCSHGIWVYEVPRLDIERDQGAIRRFINFIDVVYDDNIPIVLDMAAAPLQLIQRTDKTPQLWGDFTLRMRQQANTFKDAWDKLFEKGALTQDKWVAGCVKGGLHATQATMLWSMMPLRGGLLCEADVRNGMCLYLVYGMADSTAWTGDLFCVEPEDSNQVWTRSFLQFLCGAATPDAFAAAVEAAGRFDGFPCSAVADAPTSSSDVVFAVPRLLSRLVEIQKDYQRRHPLLCSIS